ncbi:uncharacterized protein PHACADRAFT_246748 [Phanerochaete carnosa HHB-10118-sp]|uniref:BAH domain-containing protein n=1 Tax=Phanerochaete carnosa (strain HHB-10118-sp) TaxID=650164 RepID=K5WN85_PHACS|nr:uncharacterized protein PHACADRAFT_246748 [Phanerochaete carnosa HHB-10118-sp]EKM60679.1 hypothetical protein PHACADRAFT_246748 [Phanerochaete carnosa HHB-10118-sp]
MFLNLVDKDYWAEYYELVPSPRALNGVKEALAKNTYKDPLQAYEDLNLVFLNALFYNEETSQISKDAAQLKRMLDEEWRKRPLPTPPEALPPTSAQVVHKVSLPEHALASTFPTPAVIGSSADPAPTTTPMLPTTPVLQPESTPQSAFQLAPRMTPAPPTRATAVPRTPERQMTPEIDVDGGGSPEPETTAQDMALDGESDAIVQQLEKGLPRWEGFADVGWANDIPEERFLPTLQAISQYQDSNGNRLASSLEALPEETEILETPYKNPLSLSLIESRAKERKYHSAEFDKDMETLFLKGRRWYEPTSDGYANVLVLQRFYQALVSPEPPSGPPYTSKTNFAGLPASPGIAKPLHSTDAEGVPGVTAYRVSTKDRQFVDSVQYKGWTIKMADWVHLANCDDPCRPIIGQVFRCWISEEPSKKGHPGITVCWYFRPEQTYHPAMRQFWEGEVFKTSHFADHPVEDLIEKVACQFTARHIRGRPRPPYWYPGWPLFVCDSRYNDRERIFVKIKNWNSCVPEEVRKSAEFMPIYPFERPVFPRRFASPFVAGKLLPGRAPGGIGDVIERPEGEKLEGGGIGRKRTRRNAPTAPGRIDMTDRVGQSKGLYVGPPIQGQPTPATPAPHPHQAYPHQHSRLPPRPAVDRSILTAAGGAALGTNGLTERLPSETGKYFDRDPETNEVLWFAAPPIDVAHPPGPQYSLEYLNFLAQKRRRVADDVDGMDVDQPPAKKQAEVRPTMAEQVQKLLAELNVPSP